MSGAPKSEVLLASEFVRLKKVFAVEVGDLLSFPVRQTVLLATKLLHNTFKPIV
jgi:hypothetical protein